MKRVFALTLSVLMGFFALPVLQATAAPKDLVIIAQVMPGTVRGGEASVRALVYDRADWSVVSGVPVSFNVAGTVQEVTTDAFGQATAQVKVATSGDPLATVNLSVAATADYAAASTTTAVTRQTLPAADIVFLVDESFSMGSAQDAVRSQINTMAGQLAPSLDYTFGVWGFPNGHGATNAHPHWPQTTVLGDFATGVNNLYVMGGSSEWGTDAIALAMQPGAGWRPGAVRCVVLIGDESLQENQFTSAQAAKALADNNATLFSITSSLGRGYAALAVNSGGKNFSLTDFTANPQPVMTALLNSCTKVAQQRPDLSVAIDDNLVETVAGTTHSYVVTVTNKGMNDATGVVAEVTLDSALQPLNGGSNTVTLNVGSLAVGQTWTGTVEAKTSAAYPGGTVKSGVTVADDGSLGADPTPADNADIDTTVIKKSETLPSPSPSPVATPSISVVRPGLPNTGVSR